MCKATAHQDQGCPILNMIKLSKSCGHGLKGTKINKEIIMFKFIHAADIHLDSPLRGLARYEGAPADRIVEIPNAFPFRGATYIARGWADQ